MPKGRGRGSGGGHKGQRRHFTNPDQLAENKEKEERERRWREARGEISSEESEEEQESSSSESEEEEAVEKEKTEEPKAKGVQHLIEIENPNRVVKKDKKVSQLQVDAEGPPLPQLSRREREEIEKQKAKAHYQRMHAAGRTAEAKEDLARLAIIRKQREEAAKKREEENKAKQKVEAAKAEATKKALGKKT